MIIPFSKIWHYICQSGHFFLRIRDVFMHLFYPVISHLNSIISYLVKSACIIQSRPRCLNFSSLLSDFVNWVDLTFKQQSLRVCFKNVIAMIIVYGIALYIVYVHIQQHLPALTEQSTYINMTLK